MSDTEVILSVAGLDRTMGPWSEHSRNVRPREKSTCHSAAPTSNTLACM